ncbi:ABC transporter ATP-binding protein [Nocardiopsis sp. CNT-189]|uniref:ABC transporter ATP-binding protein n=1 Tax=Nocardiopsis oceanisediminis TaxID=2816862 RepID=UPI003B350306
MSLVEVERARREFPGGVVALDGVSLRIGQEELVAIVGASGSGKSTLLNIIGTLDRPTSGRVRIGGRDVAGLDDRRLSALRAHHIGFVFQRFHLAPGVPAVRNVAEGLLYSGVPLPERLERAARALETVGLGDRLDHRPHELSGGECQRVAIARAVAPRPRLLLADEPTGSLDSASGREVVELLRRLNGRGTAVVVITHDRDIAAELPRRLEIRDGRLVGDTGPPRKPEADRTAEEAK